MSRRAVLMAAFAVLAVGASGLRTAQVRTTPAAVAHVASPHVVSEKLDAAPSTTAAPTTTTAAPTTSIAVPPSPTVPPPPPGRDLSMYNGLGTWVDVYDWSLTYGKDGALVEVATVDQMAAAGVQTLYVQTSKWDSPTDVLEPDRLLPIIERARALGIRVVAWYLPTFEDPQADMAKLMASARLPVDALAVDIESLKMGDVAERNRRLVEISTNLRRELPDVTLGAIPFPPVVTDVINPRLWPDFPWAALKPLYDIWLPMSYQTERRSDSEYRDPYRYMAENIDRLRANLGDPATPVHAIGGIADEMTTVEVDAIHRAAVERAVVGGSLYDWRTTKPELWPALGRFRA